jgi:predicted sugar kinase
LPAAVAGDLPAFSEAVHEFNRRAGEPFAAAQGGAYAGEIVASLVAKLRSLGVTGAGQSSWGPAVFAVVADQDRGDDLARRLRRELAPPAEVFVTRACHQGAEVVTGP